MALHHYDQWLLFCGIQWYVSKSHPSAELLHSSRSILQLLFAEKVFVLAISKFPMLFCLVCPKDHKIKATTASLILYRSSL